MIGNAPPSELSSPNSPDDLPPPPRACRVPELPVLPRQLAGYELGTELGRGGMGVVYRAHDPRLDRPVALKLILAGVYSGKTARERFLAEARVTARLRHPNIIQIYEVGEENSVPFMALELVEGGTLARQIAGRPLAPRRAAELIEIISRAVGYAHSRDVIHRDLKPANVLIASDGPKVADFGVAEVLDPERSAKSGVLAGTPSYMAPEQTRGVKLAGPLADIYALGAILYECLTSRPPFKAATPLETLDLVRGRAPVPPVELQPGVPHDLNTICLKCLEKEPARRYATAEALADDLARFLRGEPIVARPIGRAERSWRWVRRNPRDAALVAALVATLAFGFAGVLWQWQRADGLYHESESRRIESEDRKVQADRARAASEANFRELQKAVDNTVYLVNTIDPDELFNLRMLPVRRELLEPALKANREFVKLFDNDVEREPEVVAALFRVAILTRLIVPSGGSPEAREAVRASLEIGKAALARHQRFADAHPDVVQHKRVLAASYHNVGFLSHRLGESAEALAFLTVARKIREDLCDNQPENLDYQSELAGVLNDVGLVWLTVAQRKNDPSPYATAEQVLRSARERQRKAWKDAPHVPRYRILAANHAFNLAKLVAEFGKSAEVATLVDEMLTARPDDTEVLVRAARVLAAVSTRMQPMPEAEEHAARAVRLARRAFLEMPDRPLDSPLVHIELQSLKDRPDFEDLLKELAALGSQPDRRASAERQ